MVNDGFVLGIGIKILYLSLLSSKYGEYYLVLTSASPLYIVKHSYVKDAIHEQFIFLGWIDSTDN